MCFKTSTSQSNAKDPAETFTPNSLRVICLNSQGAKPGLLRAYLCQPQPTILCLQESGPLEHYKLSMSILKKPSRTPLKLENDNVHAYRVEALYKTVGRPRETLLLKGLHCDWQQNIENRTKNNYRCSLAIYTNVETLLTPHIFPFPEKDFKDIRPIISLKFQSDLTVYVVHLPSGNTNFALKALRAAVQMISTKQKNDNKWLLAGDMNIDLNGLTKPQALKLKSILNCQATKFGSELCTLNKCYAIGEVKALYKGCYYKILSASGATQLSGGELDWILCPRSLKIPKLPRRLGNSEGSDHWPLELELPLNYKISYTQDSTSKT